MNPRERTVVYSLLGILAMSQLVIVLSSGAGSAAWATARALFEEVGPATAVHLIDADDSAAKEIVLHNKGGKLRFGDSEHQGIYSVGFMHVGKALTKLMDTDSFREARERLKDEFQEKDAEFRQRMQAFEEENRDVKPDSPNFEEVRQRALALREEYSNWQREIVGRQEQLIASQIEQAYRDLVAAVDVVADREGVDIVYRFIPTEDEFEAPSPAVAYESIRARVAIKYPDGLDITDQVLEELDLDVD